MLLLLQAAALETSNPTPMSTSRTMQQQRRLVWHRRDLRLADNELYRDLAHDNDNVVVVSLYVLDPDEFCPRTSTCCVATGNRTKNCHTPVQSVTRGPHACRVLVDALTDLRRDLRARNSDLIIRRGNPLTVVPAMAREMRATHVMWSEEPGVYETQLSQRLRQHFSMSNVDADDGCIQPVVECSCCLYHPNDLPVGDAQWSRLAHPKQKQRKRKLQPKPSNLVIPGTDTTFVNVSAERLLGMPCIMGDFRRACRSFASVRPLRQAPTMIHSDVLGDIDPGELPTMQDLTRPIQGVSLLGLPASLTNELIENAKRNKEYSCGGASHALTVLHNFLQSGEAATADCSLADVAHGNSSRLSAYLAVGALSPRQVYFAAMEHEGCQWLVSHMEMRDFFMYYSFLKSTKAFRQYGPGGKNSPNVKWKPIGDTKNCETFAQWATGKTGLPMVDAAMKELIKTGYCSNRVRQNVASLLSKDLQLDWRAGAEWFQICLEDHCVAANYGNWSYFSGTGSDPKNRHFRTVSQAFRYDPNGDYVRKWIPALRNQNEPNVCLRPWDFLDDWPKPIVDVKTQLRWEDLQNLQNDTGKEERCQQISR